MTMSDEGDALLDLLAEAENKLHNLHTLQCSPLAKPSPPVIAESQGRILVAEPAPAPFMPAASTQFAAPAEPEPYREPLINHPLVRSVLVMLPYDMQIAASNVLSQANLTWKKALILCLAVLIIGLLTGYITIPHGMAEKLKAVYAGFSCPVPAELPQPTVPTPAQ